MVDTSNTEKVRRVVALLPRENCGKCGFQNCGGFALAVVAGETSPFGCRKDPSAAYEIGKVLGRESPEKAGEPAIPSRFYSPSGRRSISHELRHEPHPLGHSHRERGRHHLRRPHIKRHKH